MTDAEQAQAQKLLDMCKRLGPEQMRILLTYGEGILVAMDHFGISPIAESHPVER